MENIITYLVNNAITKKRYTSSILPTIVSPQQAPNFWFKNEKKPTKEEIYRLLYVLLSGFYRVLYKGDYIIINIGNIDISIREKFRKSLIEENVLIFPEENTKGGINVSEIFNKLKISGFPSSEFSFSLLVLSYFVDWLKSTSEFSVFMRRMKNMGIPVILDEVGINDTVTLIICNLSRQKKETYVIPRLKDFIARWYGDFLNNKTESIDLILFLSSIYVRHEDYQEISEKMVNKFIYYLLRGNVSGELLVNLINLKVKYELRERKGHPYPIQKVREFLRTIH